MTEHDKERMLARDRSAILGTARYKDRSYWVVGKGTSAHGAWVRLMFRDGSKTFFADAAAVTPNKTFARPTPLSLLTRPAQSDCDCEQTGCCGYRCRCDDHCVCRGGNVYDC